MKSFLCRYIHLIVCSIILIVIGLFGFINTELIEYNSTIPICFQIETDTDTIDISLFKADETHYYVFLPSHVDMAQVKISTSSRNSISLDDWVLYDGMYCTNFETGKDYEFKIGNRPNMTLAFFQSDNIATVYINTATGNMERIHNDKEYEEPSSFMLISQDNKLIVSDENSSLKGRGNATWNRDKKSYSLKLSSEISLLGMAPSSNWILLSNSMDETNLRNKIVHELANQSSLLWTPSCEYVDVYLNGNYNGLYLLTERIETDNNHLDIDTSNGDFLCKVDLGDRWDSMRHPFKSILDRNVEITRPKEVSTNEENRIQNLVNEMEQMIVSTPDSIDISALDLDSWASRYLIDEISANADSDLASSYFYYTGNTFYAGPIWDYDNSFGNSIRSMNPCAFTAKNYNKAPYYRSPYYASLYENEAFYKRMVEIYENDFLPVLNQLINTEIHTLSSNIASATQMNSLRWQTMFEKSESTVTTTQSLIDYMQLRIDFLNRAWLDNEDYCTVQIQIEPNGSYYNMAVIRGSYLTDFPFNLNEVTWYIAGTNERFDIHQPILQDISLVQQ